MFDEIIRKKGIKLLNKLSSKNDVYLATDCEDREIVVRVVNKDVVTIYECLKNAQINGVPDIYSIEHYEEGKYIIIEEWIKGVTLLEYQNKQRLLPQDVRDIVIAICDILVQTHSFKPPIIHKDIKNSNVIIDDEKRIYLIDWGAGRFVVGDDFVRKSDTRMLGTDGYAAPEQYGFGTSDERTDIYNLGKLMNSLLTGMISNNINHDIVKNSPFTDIIKRCTMLEKKDRYQDVRLLKSDLKNKVQNEDFVDFIQYYCTNCGCDLDKQIGFSHYYEKWYCQKCGTLLMNENTKSPNSTKYPEVYWYCDKCGAFLNEQKYFRDDIGLWKCIECGCINIIDDDNIGD